VEQSRYRLVATGRHTVCGGPRAGTRIVQLGTGKIAAQIAACDEDLAIGKVTSGCDAEAWR
jgi:hypothetical protein